MHANDSMVENEGNLCILSINGQKCEVSPSNILNLLSHTIDQKCYNELSGLFSEKKNPISKELVITNYNLITKEAKRITKEKKDITRELIITNYNLKRSLRNSGVINNNIDIDNKCIYGIKVGKTNRDRAFKLLKSVLSQKVDFDFVSPCQTINELGIILYFSENDIVNEIVLNNSFKGKSDKGLKIGISMENAIELYGNPKMKSLVSAIWEDFSVFIKDETITSIKLR